MTYETILYEIDAGVATITFNRPEKLNALNDTMSLETAAALEASAGNSEVRAIMLTGAGRGFSAGADLTSGDLSIMNPGSYRPGDHLKKAYHPLINAIVNIEKPVIGVVNGIAAGIGMSVALATDVRIMGEKAAFTLGFSKIGLVPDGGANWILPRLIGYARAFQIAATSEKVSAEQSLAWGLVNHVVPQEQLMPFALATAQKLASGPTVALGLTKKLMRQALEETFVQNLETEAEVQNRAGQTADHREGVMAFIEKRAAVYSGK